MLDFGAAANVAAFTVGGVGAAPPFARFPSTPPAPPPLKDGFADSGLGFWMVADGAVVDAPAVPLGSVFVVLFIKDLGRA